MRFGFIGISLDLYEPCFAIVTRSRGINAKRPVTLAAGLLVQSLIHIHSI